MTRYLIFGNGFIGNKFLNFLPNSDIVREKMYTIADIKLQIEKHNPDIVINCIGKTGKPNVDWCENHKEETFFSNVTIPTFLADTCQKYNKYMVHIGSGCIYEGDNRFVETNEPNFKGSFYSRTKIYSEQILKYYDDVLQLRIRMPVDDEPSSKNLITKLINYKKVINIKNSVTCIPDLMKIAYILMEKRETGIFNVVNEGSITHKEILDMYKEMVDPNYEMPIFISIEELGTIAQRSNCTLSIDKLNQIGIKTRNAKDALRECMEEYRKWVKK